MQEISGLAAWATPAAKTSGSVCAKLVAAVTLSGALRLVLVRSGVHLRLPVQTLEQTKAQDATQIIVHLPEGARKRCRRLIKASGFYRQIYRPKNTCVA